MIDPNVANSLAELFAALHSDPWEDLSSRGTSYTRNREKCTDLQIQAKCKWLQLQIENRKPPASLTSESVSGFYWACAAGCETILHASLDINQLSPKANQVLGSQTTGIGLSNRAGKYEVVEFLLRHGAKHSLYSRNVYLREASIRGYTDLVNLWIKLNADVNFVDDRGRSPLGGACQSG